MKVLIIIPAYNEEKNIVSTVNKLIKSFKHSKYDMDYIIINDGSTDKTLEICKKKHFNVINLISNLGIGGAIQTGYKYAYANNYDIAIQFDGDGQHDEAYIDELINEINKGNDLVIGSRFIGNLSEFTSSTMRKIGIKILSFIIKICFNELITDPTSGFRAANKKIIKIYADEYPNEYPEPESIARIKIQGYKIKEIPVKMYERQYGKSSINPIKSAYYMFSVALSLIAIKLFYRKD